MVFRRRKKNALNPNKHIQNKQNESTLCSLFGRSVLDCIRLLRNSSNKTTIETRTTTRKAESRKEEEEEAAAAAEEQQKRGDGGGIESLYGEEFN
jgi:hypothetical protein